MAHRYIRSIVVWLIAGSMLSVVGCGISPTYPKEELVSDLKDMLSKEDLNASVKLTEHTLAVHVDYDNALLQSGDRAGLGPKFEEVSLKTLPAIHRVLLSTDADIRFYILLITDPDTPGIYLTLVRYVDDIRRANVNMINTPEFFSRTVVQFDRTGTSPINLADNVLHDIRLDEFLSQQMAQRIRQKLMEAFKSSGLVKVEQCLAQFRNREFAFGINVVPALGNSLDDDTIDKVFDIAIKEISYVLDSYKFEEFDRIRLVQPFTGRHLTLPKAHLEPFR